MQRRTHPVHKPHSKNNLRAGSSYSGLVLLLEHCFHAAAWSKGPRSSTKLNGSCAQTSITTVALLAICALRNTSSWQILRACATILLRRLLFPGPYVLSWWTLNVITWLQLLFGIFDFKLPCGSWGCKSFFLAQRSPRELPYNASDIFCTHWIIQRVKYLPYSFYGLSNNMHYSNCSAERRVCARHVHISNFIVF